jgi:uroporphyrinogen decarboxylase
MPKGEKIMTMAERLHAVLRFEQPDRPFFFPTIGFWAETIQRWHGEGLPAFVFHDVPAFLYFDFDHWLPFLIGDHELPNLFPPFAPRVLEKKGKYEIFRDHGGKIYKRFRDGSSSIPQFLEAPVKTMDDYRALRWRLDPGFPGRCANPVFDLMAAYCKLRGAPGGMMVSGLFGFHRHLLGVETLMTAYYDTPDMLHAMGRDWARLCKGCIRRLRKRYGITLVNFWEDMCFRSGPMISPRTFREFMTPYYKEVISDARDQGVEFFWVDTDGDCSLVIPLFEEAGVNLLYPFEAQAGMDIVKVRADHPRMAILGGLDKRVLAKDRAAIEEEVMSKVPAMLKSGGYIAALDHTVPPDVPLENFKFYLELLKSRELAGRGIA